MATKNEYLTIGTTASRSGVATSALRFYESRGLIESTRVNGNHRRYHRSMLRRIAIIKAAQILGLTLTEISLALSLPYPKTKTPTRKDWNRLSKSWGKQLDKRIEELQNSA